MENGGKKHCIKPNSTTQALDYILLLQWGLWKHSDFRCYSVSPRKLTVSPISDFTPSISRKTIIDKHIHLKASYRLLNVYVWTKQGRLPERYWLATISPIPWCPRFLIFLNQQDDCIAIWFMLFLPFGIIDGIPQVKLDQYHGYWCIAHRAAGHQYPEISDIRRILKGNTIVDHSDAVAASPVDVAPATSSFST